MRVLHPGTNTLQLSWVPPLSRLPVHLESICMLSSLLPISSPSYTTCLLDYCDGLLPSLSTYPLLFPNNSLYCSQNYLKISIELWLFIMFGDLILFFSFHIHFYLMFLVLWRFNVFLFLTYSFLFILFLLSPHASLLSCSLFSLFFISF